MKTIHRYNKWPFHNKTYLTVWFYDLHRRERHMYTQHMASRHRKSWIDGFWLSLEKHFKVKDLSLIAVILHMEKESGENLSHFYFKHSLAHSNPSQPAREVIISDTPKTVTKRQINWAKGLNQANATGCIRARCIPASSAWKQPNQHFATCI